MGGLKREKLKSEGAYNCNSHWWFCSGLKSQPWQVSPWLTEAMPRSLLFHKNNYYAKKLYVGLKWEYKANFKLDVCSNIKMSRKYCTTQQCRVWHSKYLQTLQLQKQSVPIPLPYPRNLRCSCGSLQTNYYSRLVTLWHKFICKLRHSCHHPLYQKKKWK